MSRDDFCSAVTVLIGLAALLIGLYLASGCNERPVVIKVPPVPTVEPDLEPGAREIESRSAELAAELRAEAVRAELKTAAETLKELAETHHVDVTEQRRQVDAALGMFEDLRTDYIALSRREAQQAGRIAALEEDAKTKAWLSKVVTLGGMLCLVVLLVVTWFGPVAKWLKPWLLTGIVGAGLAGAVGYFAQVYAAWVLWGAVVIGGLTFIGGVLYVIFNEKARDKLLGWVKAMGKTIYDHPDSARLAAATKAQATPGLSEVLDDVGCRVEPAEP